jgi:N-acetylmuramoyl-L-alanine amidase
MVWTAFGIAMTVAAGGLLLTGGDLRGGPLAASLKGEAPAVTIKLDHNRWKSIIIHHSASPGGSPESLDRLHRSWGFASLGYHFVIGNGIDYGDGALYAGPRWTRQEPGAHVADRAPGAQPSAAWFNERAIGICLVGNGERRSFTEGQLAQLTELVADLQREFGIADSQVYLHSDLSDVASPGRFFPVAAFEASLGR